MYFLFSNIDYNSYGKEAKKKTKSVLNVCFMYRSYSNIVSMPLCTEYIIIKHPHTLISIDQHNFKESRLPYQNKTHLLIEAKMFMIAVTGCDFYPTNGEKVQHC